MASDQSLPVSEPVTDAAIVTPPPKIKSRKKIIDPVELEKAVDALWEAADKPESFRTELLALLRQTVDEGRSEIERRFLDSNDGAEAIQPRASRSALRRSAVTGVARWRRFPISICFSCFLTSRRHTASK